MKINLSLSYHHATILAFFGLNCSSGQTKYSRIYSSQALNVPLNYRFSKGKCTGTSNLQIIDVDKYTLLEVGISFSCWKFWFCTSSWIFSSCVVLFSSVSVQNVQVNSVKTNIPIMVYRAIVNRELFYPFSQIVSFFLTLNGSILIISYMNYYN